MVVCATGTVCVPLASSQAAPITDYFPDGGSAAQLPDIDTSLDGPGSTGTVNYDYDASSGTGTLQVDVDSGTADFEFEYDDSNSSGTSPGTLTGANFLIADVKNGTGGATFHGDGGYVSSLSGDAVKASPGSVTPQGYFEITGTPDSGLAGELGGNNGDPILTGTLVAVGTTNSGGSGNGVGEFIWEVSGGRADGLFGDYVYTRAEGTSGAQLDWTDTNNDLDLDFSSASDVLNFNNTPGRIVPLPPALPMLGTAIAGLLLWGRRRTRG